MGFPADWISAHYASHVLVGHLVKWNPNESQMTQLIEYLIARDVKMFLSKLVRLVVDLVLYHKL